MSNGAPFWICAKKLPDDPNVTVGLMPVLRSKLEADAAVEGAEPTPVG